MWPSAKALIVGVWLAVVAYSTVSRASVWADPVALWAAAVETAPFKPRPWVNLGNVLVHAGRPFEAQAAYYAALRVSATRPDRRVSQTYAALNLAVLACRASDRAGMARALALADGEVLWAVLRRFQPEQTFWHLGHAERCDPMP